MENYKQASQQKLRFITNKGVLSVEQLWDLPIEDLDSLAVSLEAAHNQSGKKSFLVKSSEKDKALKLRFDIALDILTTRVEQRQAATEAAEARAHDQKILAIIAGKEEEELKGMSVEELEKMLIKK